MTPMTQSHYFTSRRLAAGALTLAAGVFACNAALTLAQGAQLAAAGDYDVTAEITSEEIKADLFWLADDARGGRSVTSDGLNEAADYIAKRFESLGLKTIQGLDGYYQPFDLPFGSQLVEEKTSLSAEGVKGFELGKTFTPLAWSKGATFEGELVFAGYGINSQANSYNDYADLDVTGKVVLVMNHEPHNADGKSRFSNSDRPSREGRLFAKARAAQEAGAVAMLVVNPPKFHEEEDKLMEFGRGGGRAEIPVFNVNRGAANSMLRAAGLPNLRVLQDEIDKSGQPAKHEPKNPLKVSGGFEASERVLTVKNVVGLLPGKKTDEYIVVGGHYDHVGMGEYGSSYGRAIHNGADDNGSGTTTVLALAEAWAKNPEKPERSIIFMTFTAEELGLIGSRHFADHPPVPIEQIVAMVNLDMVGRIRENKLSIGGYNSCAAFPEIIKAADKTSPLELNDMGDDFAGRSDHASFINKGVPALFFFSGLHEQYHSPDDDPPLINYKGMEQAAEMIYGVMQAIDQTPRAKLAFTGAQEREMMGGQAAAPAAATGPTTTPGAAAPGGDTGQPQRNVRFGVMPDMAATSGEGLAISGVIEGSPAAKAGLKQGDTLLKIGDAEVKSLQDLQDILVAAEPGTTVTVTFKRDGAEQQVQVTYEAPVQR